MRVERRPGRGQKKLHGCARQVEFEKQCTDVQCCIALQGPRGGRGRVGVGGGRSEVTEEVHRGLFFVVGAQQWVGATREDCGISALCAQTDGGKGVTISLAQAGESEKQCTRAAVRSWARGRSETRKMLHIVRMVRDGAAVKTTVHCIATFFCCIFDPVILLSIHQTRESRL
jgi:hypothetical protein